MPPLNEALKGVRRGWSVIPTSSGNSKLSQKMVGMVRPMRTQARVDRLLARLRKVRRTRAGWTALCPAHDDREPSLSINEGDDGRILLYCHAGCSTQGVLLALDMTFRDLFPRRR